jgi:hypothetical protein
MIFKGMTKPVLPKGIYPQIYRGKIPGNTQKEKVDNLCKQLDLFKALGMPGVLMHGFTTELTVDKFKELEKYCTDRGLLCIPAFGLNSDTPAEKGKRMGAVAAASKANMLVLDMEGAWEDEAADKANAKIMGNEIRKLAPNALIIDQPWPIPDVHWSMFPWEETADYVDIRAPQVYVNNFRSQWGKDAYEKFWAWHEKSWAKLEDRLVKAGKPKPVKIPSIQGYFWMINDLIKCLTANDTVIMWCEPFPTNGSSDPDDNTIRGIKAVNKLKTLGFSGPNAVANFQRSTQGKLTVDNDCGPKTLAALGV